MTAPEGPITRIHPSVKTAVIISSVLIVMQIPSCWYFTILGQNDLVRSLTGNLTPPFCFLLLKPLDWEPVNSLVSKQDFTENEDKIG